MKLNNLKPNGKIICGFPGVGKSTLFEQLKDSGNKVLDSDSSKFDKKDFPDNYIKHIKEAIADGYTILASSHDVVRNALIKNKMPFVLVYPSPYLEDEYIKRYEKRGSSIEFITLMKKNFAKWAKECDNIEDELVTKIKLKAKEFIGWNATIKSIIGVKKTLSEMTTRTAPLNATHITNIEASMQYISKHGTIVGYESMKPILELKQQNGISYGIVNDDIVTSIVNGEMLSLHGNEYFQLHVFYSLEEYKNQGDVSRILWFIKHHLNYSIIFYGLQSPDAIKVIDSYANSKKFKVCWLNDKTGEIVPYENNDKRDNFIINDWKVLLEHDSWARNLPRWGDHVFTHGTATIMRDSDGI